jgi:RNA polymerase sigma-70 factor (ECF subfamily)
MMTALEGQALLDHGKSIARRYAWRIGPDTAEELRGEAMLRALASPPPDGRMEPWLERIYRNLLIDLWRRSSVRMAEVVDLDALPAEGTPEEEVLRRERRRIVRSSLRSLPRESRRALLSKYYGEDRDDAAAVRFGVAAVTVRTRIHRALARLRTRVGELRACLPTLFGRLGAQLAATGVAPAMVAALLVASANVAIEPRALVEPPVVAPAPAMSRVARPVAEAAPLSQPTARPHARVRMARPAPVIAPAQSTPEEPVMVGDADSVSPAVANILVPEGLVVFAEPERTESPCMIEAPATFAPQIEKMIEEEL